MRADFNVSLGPDGQVKDEQAFRIRAALPTLEFLLNNGARVVIVSHLGRPAGPDAALSLAPIAEYLRQALEFPVHFTHSFNWADLKRQSKNLAEGQVLLLENIRFLPGEVRGDRQVAQNLAQLAEVFVNEAFSVSHRDHASITGLPQFLSAYAGWHLIREVRTLTDVFKRPKHPLTLVMGGIKMGTKAAVLRRFWDKADHFCLGGVLANTLLHLKGIAIGNSLIEKSVLGDLQDLRLTDPKLHLPVDTVVSRDPDVDRSGRLAPVGKLSQEEVILDIGPDTARLFGNVIRKSAVVVWNGPMGKFEVEGFHRGTLKLAETLAAASAFSIVGGGDTITALTGTGFLSNFDFVSTGGGAMLELLAGKTLPGLAALEA